MMTTLMFSVTNLDFVNCIDIKVYKVQQFACWQPQYCRSCYFDNIRRLAMVLVLVVSSNALLDGSKTFDIVTCARKQFDTWFTQ